MSMTKALSNALAGLSVVARGTEVVSGNLSNIMTPGYARRELALSVQSLGAGSAGVRVDGITRAVNQGLLAASRQSAGAAAATATLDAFAAGMADVVGMPGSTGALSTALTQFRSALTDAAARPDDTIRLSRTVGSALRLADGLNAAGLSVQAARAEADRAIGADVTLLNRSLDRVAYLNARIASVSGLPEDVSGLMDERQAVIDLISEIVPIQEVDRDAGKVALFSTSGAVLLDGSRPVVFTFAPAEAMSAEQEVTGPLLSLVAQDGVEMTGSQMRMLQGGRLEANFTIRDEEAPRLQAELDAIAYDLQARLGTGGPDPSIVLGQAGLFTDAGAPAQATALTGLAGRLGVNMLVRADKGGDATRLRTGLYAPAGPVGDAANLTAMAAALDVLSPSVTPSRFVGNASMTARLADLEGRVALRRVEAQTDNSIRTTRHDTIASALMAEGVDSDTEMQKLLQYESAYAANARVIQAIDDMLDQLLRI